MSSLQDKMAEADKLASLKATRLDGTILKGAEAKAYLENLMDTNDHCFMRTDVEAPMGALRWMLNDTESIPLASQIDYELTYDECGRVYPALALRDAQGDAVGAVQFSADGLLELGDWCLKMAFSKLELAGMGVGSTTNRSVLVNQVNEMLNSIVKLAPDVLTSRVADVTKKAVESDMELGIRARVEAEAVILRNAQERKHAAEIMELAKIAGRRNEESREEALSSPLIEKMIVSAKELLDDDSPSSTLAALTRQG